MSFHIVPSISLLPFLLVLLIPNLNLISCTPWLNSSRCSNSRYAPENPSDRADLDQLLSTLPSKASQTGFYNSSEGRIFGLAICLDDTSPSDCLNCLNLVVQNLTTNPRCNYSTSAASWFDRCMLHYTDANFISLPKTLYYYCHTWGDREDYQPNSDSSFTTAVINLMKNLSLSAAYNSDSEKMFAVREMSYPLASIGNTTIYGLAQCTRDLSANNCSVCLANYTATLLSQSCSKEWTHTGGAIYGESCFFWYDKRLFYNSAAPPPPPIAHGGSYICDLFLC